MKNAYYRGKQRRAKAPGVRGTSLVPNRPAIISTPGKKCISATTRALAKPPRERRLVATIVQIATRAVYVTGVYDLRANRLTRSRQYYDVPANDSSAKKKQREKKKRKGQSLGMEIVSRNNIT